MRTWTAARALATALAAMAGIVMAPAPANAATTYPVMNTSEYPPDGVWFRNSPNHDDTSRVTGWGIYANDRVELKCWASGTNVPRRDGGSNLVWYQATNVTRPTAPGPRPNAGWVNAHFVNDGMGPNQAAPGVPQCGTTSPTPPIPAPGGASVFYHPYPGDTIQYGGRMPWNRLHVAPQATKTLYKPDWTAARCSGGNAGRFDDVINGRRVTTLAGWSIGRMGPLYFLRDYPNRARNINYLLLFDPGTYSELMSDCDRANLSQTLANWLATPGADNRLAILAGVKTYDAANPSTVNGRRYYHRGIQDVYFPAIRGKADLSQRVAVCNYNAMSHEDVFVNFQFMMNQPPITTSCPRGPDGAKPAPWRP